MLGYVGGTPSWTRAKVLLHQRPYQHSNHNPHKPFVWKEVTVLAFPPIEELKYEFSSLSFPPGDPLRMSWIAVKVKVYGMVEIRLAWKISLGTTSGFRSVARRLYTSYIPACHPIFENQQHVHQQYIPTISFLNLMRTSSSRYAK